METGKNSQTNIARAYLRYLKLQRGYSANTLDAYQRDLDKLLVYLEAEDKHVLDVQLKDSVRHTVKTQVQDALRRSGFLQRYWIIRYNPDQDIIVIGRT